MAVDLKEKMLAGFTDQDFIDVRTRTVSLYGMIRNRSQVGEIRNLRPELHEKRLQHILLGLPIPPIYLLEHQDVTYTVIKGKDFVDTAAAIIEFQNDYEPRHLVRKVCETEVQLITIRCNMPDHSIERLFQIMELDNAKPVPT